MLHFFLYILQVTGSPRVENWSNNKNWREEKKRHPVVTSDGSHQCWFRPPPLVYLGPGAVLWARASRPPQPPVNTVSSFRCILSLSCLVFRDLHKITDFFIPLKSHLSKIFLNPFMWVRAFFLR